jgi:hypothetical protein
VVEAASTMSMRSLVETQDLFSNIVDAHLHRVFAKGGGSKLCSRDEDAEIELWLDSSLSPRVRCFLLKG